MRPWATAEPVTDSRVEQSDDQDGRSSQDIVDSTAQSSELLEPEPVALRSSTRVNKPPKIYVQGDCISTVYVITWLLLTRLSTYTV